MKLHRLRQGNQSQKGFTLIELLIVVAIILILIAIALPNFLEAQIRARVSRVKSEIRSVRIAMEGYRTDNTEYVFPTQIGMQFPASMTRATEYVLIRNKQHPGYGGIPDELTTPIQYFTENPIDFFKSAGYGVTADMQIENLPYGHPWMRYTLANRNAYPFVWAAVNRPILVQNRPEWQSKQWIVLSLGPDHIEDVFSPFNPIWAEYSPTNGTKSRGDISESGP